MEAAVHGSRRSWHGPSLRRKQQPAVSQRQYTIDTHPRPPQRGRFLVIRSPLALSLCLLAGSLAVAQVPETVPGRILVKPKSTLAEADFAQRLQGHGAGQRRSLGHSNVRVIAVDPEKTAAVLRALRNDPDIEFAEPDPIVHVSFSPNDPYVVSGQEWHLARLGAQQAWDLTTGSSNVVVAVLDSGANGAHPDLAGRLLDGYNFVANTTNWADDLGHGTAVAGTISAVANNQLGVAGLAPNCRMLPVKVADASGSAAHSAMAAGIEYAVAHGARIINLSLGGDATSQTLQEAIDYAWAHNVVLVAAAGNTGGDAAQYPAACEHVTAVSATTQNDTLAPFSTYGPFISLAAPGEYIWTTQADLANPYLPWSGTSVASPLVAAVAALVVSANPALSNSQIVDLLKRTADDLGPAGFDTSFGFGRVNAFRAVSAATTTPPPSPTVSLTSPVAGTAFYPGEMVPLAASTSISFGSVTSVEFYASDLLLATTTPPLGFNWAPAQTGSYSLTAVAISDQGRRATSAPVTIEISSPQTGPSLLVVQINGLGAVSPALNGKMLEIGKTYAIKAIPRPGQVFAGWTGAGSREPLLTFVMRPNLVLVANFVPSPFPAVKGTYAGLLADAGGVQPESSGSFSLVLNVSGTFSGRFVVGTARKSFRGRFDATGAATATLPRAGLSPLSLALRVDLTNGTDQVTGQLSDGSWISELTGNRNVFNLRLNPAPQAGARLFVLQRTETPGSAAASGLCRISASGTAAARGKLEDGRAFAATSLLAKNGDYPFFLSLNRGGEVLIGWLNFPAGPALGPEGTVFWVKAGTNGFATMLRAQAPAQ